MMMNRHAVATASHYYTFHPHEHDHEPALTSLAYRPLHLPLQQSEPRLQPQFALAAATNAFQQPNFRLQYQPSAVQTRQQRRQARNMAEIQHPGTTDEEFAELQKLSNEWKPEVTGPLVGQRQPSTAITTEYASADPVLQAKTAALPQKYSHYRTVRGDGGCGWRAIAFGYFETLIYLGDGNKFLEEETRLRSLSNIMVQAGMDPALFEDFVDETFELLRKIADATLTGNAEDVLLESFNDEMLQNYVIAHLKSLTASWMKTHPQDYAPYLPAQTVDEYTDGSVMPIQSEMEHVSLTALKDVFLSPAGITLEVLYLDRSEGNEVNMHRFSPSNNNIFGIGTIQLLYRPGHYDLLYKLPPEMPTASIPATIPTYLQYASHPHHEPAYELGVSDFMTMIPGMSYAHPHQAWMSPSNYTGSDFFASPGSVQPSPPAVPTRIVPASQPQVQPQHMYLPSTTSHLVPPPIQIPQELPIRTVQHASVSPHHVYQHQHGGPFRPSIYEFEPDIVHATSQVPFQTSIFRNSHFNTAHFMNPDFQPEEWHPDDEYVTTSSKSSRHRNSG